MLLFMDIHFGKQFSHFMSSCGLLRWNYSSLFYCSLKRQLPSKLSKDLYHHSYISWRFYFTLFDFSVAKYQYHAFLVHWSWCFWRKSSSSFGFMGSGEEVGRHILLKKNLPIKKELSRSVAHLGLKVLRRDLRIFY